ncbi:vWA domain-containing protein [Bacillus massiliglaciei]|uniref:vWA domain-containing protein n=1 Tax=Bacillus massiliglaciei TaxID=1816693 RepID=UPI000AA2DBB4|nr:VWA domain-containing protein [Bacillus massiliglaciei]
MKAGTLRQILLITDGCSNHGEDPAAMAALAREQGISVNVIGVMENDTIDERGLKEIEAIAVSGGGVSQIVYAQQLSQTVQMVTQKAMTQTIQGVINRELQQILGDAKTMEDLPPDKRGEVMEVVDEISEVSRLEILVLVDCSASMTQKLPTVKDSLLDLSLSMNARMGDNQFSVFVFPGKRNEVEKILDWTPKLEALTKIFPKLTTGGLTPTGPALREALSAFKKNRSLKGLLSNDDEQYFEESM